MSFLATSPVASLVAAACLCFQAPPGDEKPAAAAKPAAEPEALPTFSPDEFLLLPLRIHVLRSDSIEQVDATLTDADIGRIVGKANRVWQQAGLRLVIESIVREDAAEQERFAETKSEGPDNLRRFLMLRPEASRSEKMLHVYFIHEFEVNGVYLGRGVAFVKDAAKLRPVDGGIDEPIPRVMSHELGHAFGLPHRQDRTNLMASGTTGTLFNAAEVTKAREHAAKFEFAATAADTACKAKSAFEAGRWGEAIAIDRELLTLPGSSSLKDIASLRRALMMQSLFGRIGLIVVTSN